MEWLPQPSFPAPVQLWGENEEGLIREIGERKIRKGGGGRVWEVGVTAIGKTGSCGSPTLSGIEITMGV